MLFCRLHPATSHHLKIPGYLILVFLLNTGCTLSHQQEYSSFAPAKVIPLPKEASFDAGFISFTDSLFICTEEEKLFPLLPVLQDEFKSMFNISIKRTSMKHEADLFIMIDEGMEDETYFLTIGDQISLTGGSYQAVAMGTVSILQLMSEQNNAWILLRGTVHDYPDMHFRGLMIDVARKKHSAEVLKQVVSLCRWNKMNYLQLHLTDEHYFSFPSDAFPQLSTENFHFTKDELIDLVQFADARGIEIIPELEVPGHAGQFVEQMPEVFGFANEKLNRFTINLARDQIYPVLDTVIGEMAAVFSSSKYIHIGGDEADFSGMDEDAEVKQYLQENDFSSVDELFWHFINRMNEMVKKRNRKAIVWEGFSKEANDVVSKDITVMAWETMYQLPDDLLDAGYQIINVSWKPLYVVNNRKWSPAEIYNWNVYQWQNWYPKAPSFHTIQIDKHPDVLGAFMASWDQPEYVEISSLRKRLPAMVERIWNMDRKLSDKEFIPSIESLDLKLDRYFSPVKIQENGLLYPDIQDGYRHEQVWFGDTLILKLETPPGYVVRFSTDEAISEKSAIFNGPVKITESTVLRYKAYTNAGVPVGHEIVKYYELNPLKITLKGNNLITEKELWSRIESWKYPFSDSLKIIISSERPGKIKYMLGDDKTSEYKTYSGPISITEDVLVTAGLFVNESLTGELWRQHFTKNHNN
jgi:hexosaminidase